MQARHDCRKLSTHVAVCCQYLIDADFSREARCRRSVVSAAELDDVGGAVRQHQRVTADPNLHDGHRVSNVCSGQCDTHKGNSQCRAAVHSPARAVGV